MGVLYLVMTFGGSCFVIVIYEVSGFWVIVVVKTSCFLIISTLTDPVSICIVSIKLSVSTWLWINVSLIVNVSITIVVLQYALSFLQACLWCQLAEQDVNTISNMLLTLNFILSKYES